MGANGKNSRGPLAAIARWTALLGPGLVTGAADDDPSGIFTYSQAGAQFGMAQLWTLLFMLPLMIAVQEMCARIAIATHAGIAAVIKQHYSKAWLYSIVGLLLIANTINLGVDLGAMAEAARLVVPVPRLLAVIGFGVIAVAFQILVPYRRYAPLLKVLCISLFTYFVTSVIVTHGWKPVLRATFVPQVHLSFEFLMLLVGLLGTTISPYMFFWQASQEHEEEVEAKRPKNAPKLPLLQHMRVDTVTGMIFSELTAWCIMLTTAEVLNTHGIKDISSAAQAASALKPLVHNFAHAGKIAEIFFALGILGTGALAVPIFAASSAYAIGEMLEWKASLALKFSQAKRFYGVMVAGTLIGMCMNMFGVNPVKALIYTAVLNGVVAVPMIFLLIRITANKKVMGKWTSGRLGSTFSWLAFAGMAAAAVLTVYAAFKG